MQKLHPEDVRAETVQAWIVGNVHIRVMCQLTNEAMSLAQARVYEFRIGRPDQSRMIFHYDDLMPSFWSDDGPFWMALESGSRVHSSRGEMTDAATGTGIDEVSLRRIWGLGENLVLAVGKGGLYRFDGRSWNLEKLPTPHILLDVHGSAPDRLLAVGNRGMLIVFDGRQWSIRDTGLGSRLRAVYAGSDGAIYVGGDEGTCFGLVGEERIDYSVGESTMHSICEFQGRRYWGDDEVGIYRQEGAALAPFREIELAYYMSSTDKYMIATSGHEMFLFDGSDWQTYVYRHQGDDWGFYLD